MMGIDRLSRRDALIAGGQMGLLALGVSAGKACEGGESQDCAESGCSVEEQITHLEENVQPGDMIDMRVKGVESGRDARLWLTVDNKRYIRYAENQHVKRVLMRVSGEIDSDEDPDSRGTRAELYIQRGEYAPLDAQDTRILLVGERAPERFEVRSFGP